MFTVLRRISTTLLCLACVGPGIAFSAKVDNFVLLDHKGDAHELHYNKSAKLVALMAHNTACSASDSDYKKFAALSEQLRDKGVAFFLINSNIADDRASIATHVNQLGSDLPVLQDEAQIIGSSLGLKKSGDVLLVDPSSWQITYRGGVETLASAIDNPQTTPAANTNGCAVSYHTTKEVPSYAKDVAPILADKCVVCHTEGGLGPWAMSSHTMVMGFSPMIKEVLRTKRMPPWHADPHIGVWKNDISLSNEQLQTLVSWIDAGSPRGEGPDPLALNKTAFVEWPLGEPDLIIDIPEHAVPASGVVDYQFPTVTNPLDKGVWVSAATVVPGDREVVHHILAGTVDEDTSDLRRDSGVFDNYLIGYAPGNESHQFPEGTGVFIPPGGDFLFQLHYTPVGRATVDRSKIGLYFHKETPENFFRQGVVINPTITIPPQEARHAEVAYYEFNEEAVLHDLVPHAHYRGVASKFELWHPDGHKETVLSVPNYDFNWQRTYEFVEPKRIPKGSRLVHTTWYDNSPNNPGNPNPEREVPWGLQSWDEMLYGAFSYTYVSETSESPIHDANRAQTAQWVGFLDKNLDGKLSWRELPKQIKKRLVQGFQAVDTDSDGGLNIEEMTVLTQRMSEARRREREREQANESAGAR
ncbi:MAG: hypothetical protein AAF541_21730 [Pseudomonadota bacterium]